MDECDMAQIREETERNRAIARFQSLANTSPSPTGFCLNCGEETLDHGRRWCCHDCMLDWSKRNDTRRYV